MRQDFISFHFTSVATVDGECHSLDAGNVNCRYQWLLVSMTWLLSLENSFLSPESSLSCSTFQARCYCLVQYRNPKEKNKAYITVHLVESLCFMSSLYNALFAEYVACQWPTRENELEWGLNQEEQTRRLVTGQSRGHNQSCNRETTAVVNRSSDTCEMRSLRTVSLWPLSYSVQITRLSIGPLER